MNISEATRALYMSILWDMSISSQVKKVLFRWRRATVCFSFTNYEKQDILESWASDLDGNEACFELSLSLGGNSQEDTPNLGAVLLICCVASKRQITKCLSLKGTHCVTCSVSSPQS